MVKDEKKFDKKSLGSMIGLNPLIGFDIYIKSMIGLNPLIGYDVKKIDKLMTILVSYWGGVNHFDSR